MESACGPGGPGRGKLHRRPGLVATVVARDLRVRIDDAITRPGVQWRRMSMQTIVCPARHTMVCIEPVGRFAPSSCRVETSRGPRAGAGSERCPCAAARPDPGQSESESLSSSSRVMSCRKLGEGMATESVSLRRPERAAGPGQTDPAGQARDRLTRPAVIQVPLLDCHDSATNRPGPGTD
jgi:hypothetical protein